MKVITDGPDPIDVNAGDLIMEHEMDAERLVSALLGEDEIGALVRCHYEGEQAINYVIGKLSPGPSSKVQEWQSFAQKLEVCGLLGVPDGACAPLKTLNKHRNLLAHGRRENITDQEVLDLYRQITAFYPQFGEHFHFQVSGKKTFDKKYSECTNKEKYVMCCAISITLFSNMPQIMRRVAVAMSQSKSGTSPA